jgi:endonuclease YncB( thermonuclease family)
VAASADVPWRSAELILVLWAEGEVTMSGWLARSNFNFKLFADVLAKFVLFVSPGLVAFVGGVFLPHCVPVSDSFARACLTFPAVDDLLPAGIGIGIPVDGAKLPPEPPQPAWTTPAKVLRVIDGDTLEIEVRRVIRVRMLDCWAPESKLDPRLPEAQREAEKQAGQAAKANLQRLADGREVIVQIPGDVDLAKAITMGRWLGRVWLKGDGESLSEKQVKGGFATVKKREELK